MTSDLAPTERSWLREFLIRAFSLGELKDLAFDVCGDYELFPCQEKPELCRELLAYFIRQRRLSCLLIEVLRRQYVDRLVQLLAKLPACQPFSKIQIIVTQDLLENVSEFLEDLAGRLGLEVDEIVLIGAAGGSLRLLIGVPKQATNLDVLWDIRDSGSDRYVISSVELFDLLNSSSRRAWRRTVCHYPPPSTGQRAATSNLLGNRCQGGSRAATWSRNSLCDY